MIPCTAVAISSWLFTNGSNSRCKISSANCAAIADNVEIYEYDTDSEKYKDLVSTGKVMLEGFNVDITPSAIHNQYVLICDDAPNKDALIDAFNSLD